MLRYELEDCENFIKYFGYGYTKFNYYHCYPKTHNVEENDKEISYKLKEKKDLLKSKYFDENKFKKYSDKLPELEEKRIKIIKKIENYKEEFEQIYAPRIKEYCKDNKIGVIQKYQDIVNMLIYQTEYYINNFAKYLKRKKINVNILDVLNKDNEFIDWRKKYFASVEINKKIYDEINECKYIKRTDDLMRILPEKEYKSFPLKDRYQEIKLDNIEDNSLSINFEFSNNGTSVVDDWEYFDYNLIKIDYRLNINNEVIEKKNIFIEPQEGDESYDVDYYEKDIGKLKFRKIPFCIRNLPDYISTTMEYQNGINEFTLKNKEKIDFNTILDEINLLINEQTTVKVIVRNRMKNKCREFIKDRYKSENLIKKKILEFK